MMNNESACVYEYRITDGQMIEMIEYKAQIKVLQNGRLSYHFRRGKYKESKMVSNLSLEKINANIVYSLEKNFDKYAKMLIDNYVQRNMVLERQLNDRKKVLENLQSKYTF